MKHIIVFLLAFVVTNSVFAQNTQKVLVEIKNEEARLEAELAKIKQKKQATVKRIEEKKLDSEKKINELKEKAKKLGKKVKDAQSGVLDSKKQYDQANSVYTKKVEKYGSLEALTKSIESKKEARRETALIIAEKEKYLRTLSSEIRKEELKYKKLKYKLTPSGREMEKKKKDYSKKKENLTKLQKEAAEIASAIKKLKRGG